MSTQAYNELQARIASIDDDDDTDVYNDIREAAIFQESFVGQNEVQSWAVERIQKLDREELTELALSMSLCPLHLCDYAICFDDEDPECAQIREIHPGHDT
jgi:hypothetical protein